MAANVSKLQKFLKNDLEEYGDAICETSIPQGPDSKNARLEVAYHFEMRIPTADDITKFRLVRKYMLEHHLENFRNSTYSPDEYIKRLVHEIDRRYWNAADEFINFKLPEHLLKSAEFFGIIDAIRELDKLRTFEDLFVNPAHAPIALEALIFLEVIGNSCQYLHGNNDKACVSAWYRILHSGQIVKLPPDDAAADLLNRGIEGLNITGKTLRNRKLSRANNETYVFHLNDRLSKNLPLSKR